MLKISVNTFTNPNGERVSQVFADASPITRELPAGDPTGMLRARRAYDDHFGHASLSTWDAENGAIVLESK